MLFEAIYRGDMYYIDPIGGAQGGEQHAGRPGIIVSNNICNDKSPVVEVVYLTTQPKNDLPTHVSIRSAAKPSTALCEQITSVSKERLSSFIGTISDDEQARIDLALAVSLKLEPEQTEAPIKPQKSIVKAVPEKLGPDIEKLQLSIERDTYKKLYESLLEKIMK